MPIAENDILKMAEKIQQNRSENRVFRKQLDKYFQGKMPSHEVINVCSTPNILKLLNSTAKKVVLNQKDLENAVANSKSGKKSHTEGHNISKEEIYNLSEALRNPIMVLKGNKRSQNSVILVTDLTNKKGEKVFVPIALDRQNGRISTISSLYGKKNLSKYISEHTSDILAINKEKVDMLADTRDQYSQSINETVTYFDNSIAYTTANVKYPSSRESEQSIDDNLKKYDVEVSIIENGSIVGWDSDAFQDSILAVDEQEAISFAKDCMRDSIKENGAVLGWDSDTLEKELDTLSFRAREVIMSEDRDYGEWVYDSDFSENKEKIIALCSAISEIFTDHYNSANHILSTKLAFIELSERCNLDDVKSVIAATILDHQRGKRIVRLTKNAGEWAASQPLSDNVKRFIASNGYIPDMDWRFLEVFATKFEAWEQERKSQSKGNSVLSRKEITRNAAQLHEQSNTATQEKSAQSKKDDQSL